MLLADGRGTAGYLLVDGGEATLIDCGPGTLLRLAQAGVAPSRIGRVLLSHFHPDHHADLLGLCSTHPTRASSTGSLTRAQARAAAGRVSTCPGAGSAGPGSTSRSSSSASARSPTAGSAASVPGPALDAGLRYRLGSVTAVLYYSGDTGLGDGVVACCRDADLAVVG
ncbi:MAG: MBL fold metallo-hydrolase [Planctomycetota bacterium]